MAITIDEVKLMIETSLTDDQITRFMTMARNYMAANLDSQTCLTDEIKDEIERLLSAHFISMRDQRVTSEKVGDASATYQGSFGMGFNSTLYGQQAIILDCSNTLVNSSKQTVGWEVLT